MAGGYGNNQTRSVGNGGSNNLLNGGTKKSQNGGARYKIYGTNEPYNGLTVEVGGYLYSTKGGALEGFSHQLVPISQK